MAVQEQTPYIEYVANGDTTSFALGFDCNDQDYLIVLIDNNPPEYGSWYLKNNTVIFRNAPQANQQISIERSTPLSRATNFKAYDNSFRPETINFDFDKLWLVLQEQNLIDGKILARLKEEIEWRRTHDLNFDELAKVREAQIFGGLKQYVDTYIASTNPNVFGGVTAGVVFALDQKSVQTHLDHIADQLEQNRNNIAAVEKGYVASFKTYELADSAKNSLPKDSLIEVTNDPVNENNGRYVYDGLTLTKSSYDPVNLAKEFTNQELKMAYEKTAIDFVSKYTASSERLLLAITDSEGNLTWVQIDKETGLPTQETIDVLREINQLSVTDAQLYTESNEKIAVAIKDKNGNLTALTVRESDGMFTDDIVEDIGERLGVMSDSAEFKTYDTPININILRSISAGITRYIEKTALPETPYNFIDSADQECRIYLPTNYNDSTPIPLVMVFDGVDGSTTPSVRSNYLSLLNQGVALCKSQGHGNSYGNSACMQSYLEVFKKACEIAPIGAVILVGNSMGGIAAQNALLTGTIPNVSGVYLTDPTYDMRQRYENGRKSEITSAYEIAEDGSDYDIKTQGYDPALRHWSHYRGVPIRILASSGDTAIKLELHGQKLKDYLENHNDVDLTDTGTAGHNTADRFDSVDLLAFIKKVTKI